MARLEVPKCFRKRGLSDTTYVLEPTQSTVCEILKGDFGSHNTITASMTMLYSVANPLNSVSVSQGSITLQSQAAGLSVSVKPDVYVANWNSNTVTAISGKQALYNVSTGANPSAIAYDPSNGYIYVANYGGGTVSIINGTALVTTVSTGSQPNGALYDSANGYVYVTDRYSNTTSVISGTTVIQSITGFAVPQSRLPFHLRVILPQEIRLLQWEPGVDFGLDIIISIVFLIKSRHRQDF